MLAVGRAHAIAARGARPETMLAHDPFDPLAADGLAFGTQRGMDARRAVSRSRSPVQRPSRSIWVHALFPRGRNPGRRASITVASMIWPAIASQPLACRNASNCANNRSVAAACASRLR